MELRSATAGAHMEPRARSIRFTELLGPVLMAAQRYACHLSNGFDDGKDVLQESIIIAWTRFPQLRNEKSFRRWLFQIIHRTHQGSIRARVRRGAPFMPLYEDEDEEDPGPIEQCWMRPPSMQQRLELREILAGLTPIDRETFLLYTLAGYNAEELGERLGCSASCMKKRLERIRKRAAKLLSGEKISGRYMTPAGLFIVAEDLTDATIKLVEERASQHLAAGRQSPPDTRHQTPDTFRERGADSKGPHWHGGEGSAPV